MNDRSSLQTQSFTDPDTVLNRRGIYESPPSLPSLALRSTHGVIVPILGGHIGLSLLLTYKEPQFAILLATATVQPCKSRDGHMLCFGCPTVRPSFWATADSMWLFSPVSLVDHLSFCEHSFSYLFMVPLPGSAAHSTSTSKTHLLCSQKFWLLTCEFLPSASSLTALSRSLS